MMPSASQLSNESAEATRQALSVLEAVRAYEAKQKRFGRWAYVRWCIRRAVRVALGLEEILPSHRPRRRV